MGDDKYLQITADFLSVGFELELRSPDIEELKQALAAKLSKLINEDFEGLLQLLYRIDVDEEKAKEALAENPLDKGPYVLAELIIERQMEKVRTREEYGKSKGKS